MLFRSIDNMNAFDFIAASNLFAAEGALQPPFQSPVVGPAAILTYMREECVGLKMLPERGVVDLSIAIIDRLNHTAFW